MKKHLVVGADPFPPYQYIDENGKVEGLDYRVIKSIIEEMGYKAEFIIREWSEIERMFNKKQLDLVFQVQKTPEREKKYYFSEKLRDAVTVIITSKQRDIKCKDLYELIDILIKNSWQLGVIKGYKYGEVIDSINKKYKASFLSTEKLIEAVNENKIELGVVDLGVLKYYTKRAKYENIKIVENAYFKRPLYVIFRDSSLRDEFNIYLRKHLETLGKYDNIEEMIL